MVSDFDSIPEALKKHMSDKHNMKQLIDNANTDSDNFKKAVARTITMFIHEQCLNEGFEIIISNDETVCTNLNH